MYIYMDGRGRDDYYSPERSRSYSRSRSPSGGKDYRRSPHPRENGRSPNDKRDQAPSRSLSPRRDDPPNEKRDRAPNRSVSPRRDDRSPSRSRSRSYRYIFTVFIESLLCLISFSSNMIVNDAVEILKL